MFSHSRARIENIIEAATLKSLRSYPNGPTIIYTGQMILKALTALAEAVNLFLLSHPLLSRFRSNQKQNYYLH